MENIESILFLVLTILAYLATASWASRGIASQDSYLLGNRQFGVFSITLTLIATQVGAGMIFGTAFLAYNNGIFGISYVLGMVIGLIILGMGVGSRLRSLEISTAAELFEAKYGSKILRKVAAIISQIVASRQLFSSLFTIGPIWLIIFWLTVITYTTFGGLKAIIATDILQVIIIVLVFTTALFYIIPFNEIPSTLRFVSPTKTVLFSQDFFSALLAPALFSLIEQDLAQRCFAAKTKKVATMSALLSALFIFIFALIPTSMGMYAKAQGIIISSGQSPLVLLCQAKLSTLGMTIIACALLAAICSTADSVLGAASTNLIADFLPKDNKFSLAIARMLTMLLGLISLIVAFNFDDVIGVLIKSYEVSIAALFVPMIAALFLKQPKKQAAIYSVVTGLLVWAICSLFNITTVASFIALIFSAAAFLLGQLKNNSI
jgi:SSS family solute:Na+ symporter